VGLAGSVWLASIIVDRAAGPAGLAARPGQRWWLGEQLPPTTRPAGAYPGRRPKHDQVKSQTPLPVGGPGGGAEDDAGARGSARRRHSGFAGNSRRARAVEGLATRLRLRMSRSGPAWRWAQVEASGARLAPEGAWAGAAGRRSRGRGCDPVLGQGAGGRSPSRVVRWARRGEGSSRDGQAPRVTVRLRSLGLRQATLAQAAAASRTRALPVE